MAEPGAGENTSQPSILEQLNLTSVFERRNRVDANTDFTDLIPLVGIQIPGQQLYYRNLRHIHSNKRVDYASLLFSQTGQELVPVGHLDSFAPSPLANRTPRLTASVGIMRNFLIEDLKGSGSTIPDWLTSADDFFQARNASADALHIIELLQGVKFRGQNLGKTLMLLFMAQAEADGYDKLYIQGIEHGAGPFYEKLGAKEGMITNLNGRSVQATYLDTHLTPEHTSFITRILAPAPSVA